MNCPFEKYLATILAFYEQVYKVDAPEDYAKIEVQTYVMLKPGASLRLFQGTLRKAIERLPTNDATYIYKNYQLLSEPLDGIYLHSKIESPNEKKGNVLFILLLIGLGLIVIVIACINVINLTTARALTREKEIGIRKTLGASRRELIVQHLVESVLLSFISFWFALVIVEVCLPLFNQLVQRSLEVHYLQNPAYLLSALAVALLIGILAGLYPAFGISSFNVIRALKGQKTPGSRRFREIMVVVQFVFSIGLFILSAVILREFQTLKSTSSGLDTKDVYMMRLNVPAVENELPTLKKSVLALPGVTDVAASSFAGWQYGGLVKDFPLVASVKTRHVDIMVVDAGYLHINGIPVVKGRDFDENGDTAEILQLVVNEAAHRQLGLEIGSLVEENQIRGRVVGIAGDFDYLPPSGRMRPLILTIHSPFLTNTSYAPTPIHLAYLLVKIQRTRRRRRWKKSAPSGTISTRMPPSSVNRWTRRCRTSLTP